MRKRMILLTALAMVFMLTGCGGMTKEKLLKEMTTATEGKEITQMTMSMDMPMSMSAEGVTAEMNMEMDMDFLLSMEPLAFYMDMDMMMKVAGEESNETIEMYTAIEDDSLVLYTHSVTANLWERQDLGIHPEDLMEASTEEIDADVDAAMLEKITLAKETQTIDDKEVYVLNYTVTAEEFQEIFENSSGTETMEDALKESGLEDVEGLEDLFNFDFTALNMPITVYVDTETYLPVQIDINIEGLGDMVNHIMTTILSAAETGIDMNLDMGTVQIICNNIGYDPVEIPTVPEDAKTLAEQAATTPDQGDNTYIIQESGDAVMITVPDGWNVVESSANRVVLNSADGTQEVWYTMYTGLYGSAFYNHVEQNFAIDFLNEDVYDSHGHLDLDVDYEGAWVKRTDGINYNFGWHSVGEAGHIFVEMVDTTGQDSKTAITPMLEIISEYELAE